MLAAPPPSVPTNRSCVPFLSHPPHDTSLPESGGSYGSCQDPKPQSRVGSPGVGLCAELGLHLGARGCPIHLSVSSGWSQKVWMPRGCHCAHVERGAGIREQRRVWPGGAGRAWEPRGTWRRAALGLDRRPCAWRVFSRHTGLIWRLDRRGGARVGDDAQKGRGRSQDRKSPCGLFSKQMLSAFPLIGSRCVSRIFA